MANQSASYPYSKRRRGLSPHKQVQLLESFADQAVIAIENTRLFEEVQARTRKLARSVDEQRALGEVGRIVSSSLDLSRVLQTVTEQASTMAFANGGAIYVFDGEKGEFRLEAAHDISAEALASIRARPLRLSDPLIGECGVRREAVQVEDLNDLPATTLAATTLRNSLVQAGVRAVLAVPLLHQGDLIGALAVRRNEPGVFSPEIVRLLEAFAAQSAIALENARLFEEVQARTRELSEALEQQTATADVLKVISRSAFNLQLVLDTLVQSAAQLCEADIANIRRPVGDAYPLAATYGLSSEQREHLQRYSNKPDRGSAYGRALIEGRTVHIPDVLADPEFNRPQAPGAIGVRTAVGVPLMREGTAIGVLILLRRQPRPFTQKQIELIETFADQAVIAIENTRLFEEVQDQSKRLAAQAAELAQ